MEQLFLFTATLAVLFFVASIVLTVLFFVASIVSVAANLLYIALGLMVLADILAAIALWASLRIR